MTASWSGSESAANFVNAPVRELAWAIAAPLMLRGNDPALWPDADWCRTQERRTHAWLQALDREPDPLQQFLSDENDRRLGARFERLIEFWLSHSEDYELLHRRLQCHNDGRTVGEFDFLVANKLTGETEHWEIASKFYLGVAQPVARHQLEWVGPGKRDRLLRKEQHLVHQQATLGQTPAAVRLLKGLGIRLDRVRTIVKGRLFYPLDFDGPSSGSDLLTDDHERGTWCTLSAARAIHPSEWVFKPKASWLEPPAARLGDDQHAGDFCAAVAPAGQRPVCVDVRRGAAYTERLMVVADDWVDDLI
ncbi:MAG: DUF1853 family protein [Gammaproteobacteria bacterium]|nr:DUF1853 family protein [Gammaproteobacteria bacterium]